VILKNIIPILLLFQFGFSQTRIEIEGTVLHENLAIQGVDVVNFTTKKVTTTDANGKFLISGKIGDELIFISKKYDLKKIMINNLFFSLSDFIVTLDKKALELDEVVITKWKAPKINVNPSDLEQIQIEKSANELKVIGVYTGTIPNGMDFVKISKMITNLFKKETSKIDKKSTIHFKDIVKSKFDEDFFTTKLKLETTQITLFIEFCDADSKSTQVLNNGNDLILMDFMFAKSIEFKKLEIENQSLKDKLK
jgi:hypothetical protein